MTSTRYFLLPDFIFETIRLNTFSKYLSSVHVNFKLSILSNYAEHPKKTSVVLHTTPFYNSKISIPNGLASSFERRWLQFCKKKVVPHKDVKPPKLLPAFPPTSKTKTKTRTTKSF